MSQSSSLRAEIYREVFDEDSAPSEEEVKDYAVKIGINPLSEPHLLNIARDGLMQALPEGWSPCYDNETKSFYYYNADSKETRWDHPLDDIYRNIVKEIRSGGNISSIGEEESKTSLKDELKSYEEATLGSEMMPKSLEPLRSFGEESTGVIKKASILAPLKGRGTSPARQVSSPDLKEATRPDTRKLSLPVKRGLIDLSMKRSTSNAELGNRPGSGTVSKLEFGSAESLPARSPARIDVSLLGEVGQRQRSLSPLQEKHPRGFAHATELTLKGGGSMFLKSKKRESPDSTSAERSLLAALEPTLASTLQETKTESLKSKDAANVQSDRASNEVIGITLKSSNSVPSDVSELPAKRFPNGGNDLSRIPLKSVPSELSFDSSGIPLKRVPSAVSDISGTSLKSVASGISDTSGGAVKSSPSEASGFFGVKLKSISSGSNLHPKGNVSDLSSQLKSNASESSFQLKGVASEESELNSLQLKDSDSDASRKGILREMAPWDADVGAMSRAQTQQWRRQQMEDERKSVRFNLDKDIGTIRFDVSDSEDTEDCTADESDVGVDGKRSTTDGSGIDRGDTQSEGDGSARSDGKRSEQDIAATLKGLFVPRERGDDGIPIEMFGAFSARPTQDKALFVKVGRGKDSINGQDVRKEHEIKDSAAAKISEKRQLGSSLFRSEVLSKSVESIVLNGDLDKSLEIDLGIGKAEEKQQRDSDAEIRAKVDLESREREKIKKELEAEEGRAREAMRKALEEEERQKRNTMIEEIEEEKQREIEKIRKELDEEELKQKLRLKKELEEEENNQRQKLKKDLEEEEKQERHRMQLELEEMKSKEQERLKNEAKEEVRVEQEKLRSEMREDDSRDQDKVRRELDEEENAERARMRKEHNERLAAFAAELLAERVVEEKKTREEHEALMKEVREAAAVEREAELTALRKRLELERQELVAALTSDSERQISVLTARLQGELTQKLAEITDRHAQNVSTLVPAQLESSQRETLARIAAEHSEEIEKLRLENSVATAAARVEHAARLDAIRAECTREEARVVELKSRLKPGDHDSSASGPVFEKLRCEKRLLEDKYRTLKDKYVRLKGDVKISLDRRRKRDSAANTTGSETERSTSHRAHDRSAPSEPTPRNDNEAAQRGPRRAADNNNTLPPTSHGQSRGMLSDDTTTQGVDSDNVSSCGSRRAVRACEPRRRRQTAGRARAPKPAATPPAAVPATAESSPVDALRRQLQKLDDLDEKFPAATHADTYLRYPFSDTGGQMGSAELEFFRHRIHLERDSVRRAKDMLVAQRGNFRLRQREIQRSSVGDDDRDLSDMEVSLHRTRGLLGEKIIRLRHLEAALARAATPRGGAIGGDGEHAALSDVSSHSGGSSGFSSIELPHDSNNGVVSTGGTNTGRYSESTEIIRSLENLNTEIRDIWDVLHKSRPSAGPPPALLFPDWLRGFRPSAAADPSLAERTKSLRDWLRHARHDTPDSPNADHAHV